ncbi:MAG: UDP-N-acetylglucosamine 2-epimerase (non-hydrolyzing) [Planctomycetota bacterium]
MSARTPRIGIVLGTRPEVIKNWSIVDALRRRSVPHHVLHTNQHADHAMNAGIFAEFGYAPDRVLAGGYTLGRAIDWVRAAIAELGLDWILVNGDTAAAVAGALAAIYGEARLAHVESGLRSYDREMPEERNRIMADAAAHLLLTYTEREAALLRQRPELRGRIVTVGNTTVDVVATFPERLARPRAGKYAYVTLHRKELTDRPAAMRSAFRALAELAGDVDEVVFPMHPRTRDAMRRHDIPGAMLGAVRVLEPIGGFDSLAHIRHAAVVLTDSGCIQEEACLLGVPCVTVRENTERVATVEIGANVLSGLRTERIVACAREQLARADGDWPQIYGPPGAGSRIVDELLAEHRGG